MHSACCSVGGNEVSSKYVEMTDLHARIIVAIAVAGMRPTPNVLKAMREVSENVEPNTKSEDIDPMRVGDKYILSSACGKNQTPLSLQTIIDALNNDALLKAKKKEN